MNSQLTITEKLLDILASMQTLAPEVSLALLFITVLLVDLFTKDKTKILYIISIVGLLISAYFIGEQWQTMQTEEPVRGFLGMTFNNAYSVFFKFLFTCAGILTILFTYLSSQVKKKGQGEFLSVLILVLLGLNLLVMANNLLMIYLSLEFVSIGSYILTLFSLNKRSSEGGMKYFIFGTVSSAIMLYGMSFIYGISGSLELNQELFLSFQQIPVWAATVIIFLTLGGILFKVSLFPFHIWVPDVYQSAPSSVAAFLSVAPKAAGFAVLLKLAFPLADVIAAHEYFVIPLIVICFVTIAVGNFSAIWQQNAKRLLAYSSIAHAGFVLCGVVAFSELSIQSVTFYLSTYLLMNFAAFLMVDMLSEQLGSEDVRKFAGLGMKLPLIGVIFVLTMISLTGLPPTVGFHAKLLVFSAVWDSYQVTGSSILLYLLLFGILNAVISLFYYLKIPYIMYFKEPEGEISVKADKSRSLLLVVLAFLMIWLFFSPNWVIKYLNLINI